MLMGTSTASLLNTSTFSSTAERSRAFEAARQRFDEKWIVNAKTFSSSRREAVEFGRAARPNRLASEANVVRRDGG